MAPTKSTTAEAAENEIVITRVVDAPREKVYEAMMDPKQVVQWWGPKGFTTTIHEMDVRPGGVWRHTMHGPDGTDYPNKSTFKEIVKNERVVYSHGGGTKEKGAAVFTATWTFEDEGGKTRITMRSVFPTKEARDHVVKAYGAIEGGKQTLSRLEQFLTGILPFVISRTFDAPRAKVWKAFTDPAEMAKWWGPKGFKVIASKMDLRPGGTYHYGIKSPEGHEMWGKFIYQEIVPQERLVFVNSFSDKDGGVTRHPMNPNWPLELLSTFTFQEAAGKTTLIIEWLPVNATEAELAAFEAGRASMTQGWGGTLEQLTAYLAQA